jgi:hypothetical protein
MLNNENWGLNNVGQTLNKAANLMDQLGQARFVTRDTDGSVCIQGAVHMALTGSAHNAGDEYELADKCFAELAKHLPSKTTYLSDIGNVCRWNNSQSTKDEAVNLMRTVAQTCKAFQTA